MDIRNFFGKSPVQKDRKKEDQSTAAPITKETPSTKKATKDRSKNRADDKESKKAAKSRESQRNQSPKVNPKRKRSPASTPESTELKKSKLEKNDRTPKMEKAGRSRSEKVKEEPKEKRNLHDISDSSDEEPEKAPEKRTKEIDPDDFFGSSSTKKASPDKLKESNKQREHQKSKLESEAKKETTRKDTTKTPDKKKIKVEVEKSPAAKRSPKKEDEEFTTPSGKRTKKEVETPGASPQVKEGRPSNSSNYLAYLHREPPRHLGERIHPEGSPNCLKGFVVVMTGVMDYVDKDEIKRIIEQCGGRVTGSISGKSTHLLAGRDAGPSKVAKANSVGAKVLEETEWLDLVESLTDKKTAFPSKETNDPMAAVMMEIEAAEAKSQSIAETPPKSKDLSPKKNGDKNGELEKKHRKEKGHPRDDGAQQKDEKHREDKKSHKKGNGHEPGSPRKSPNKAERNGDPKVKPEGTPLPPVKPATSHEPSLMWVDKYMPSTSKQIIGQQSSESNVSKLRQWLSKWSTKTKAPFNKFKNPTGSGLKAALLSGPPGIGKTTSAHLVCKELGFETIEMNASDTRNKRSLHEEVATLLANRTMNSCQKGDTPKKHVLVMDEVDGMSGNQDRGGIQELISLIKGTKVPIICICNDRSHPKMRTIVNYCFDLRFYKPQLKQIQAALMSICFKEGVKMQPKVLEEIIVASNQDIRQSIHSVNLYCAMNGSASTAEAGSKRQLTKDIKLGPFDVVKKYLVSAEGGNLDLNARSSLFFHDYNAIPLFIQENYVQVQPKNAKNRRDIVRRMAKASESICIGDMVERQIRSNQSWSLLPVQSLFSAVIPSLEVQGTLKTMVNFPQWFGKYSSTAKHGRQAQALHSHMACIISADTFDTAAQYMPLLRQKVLQNLRSGEDGVDKVIDVMSAYSLQKIDLDAVMELTSWNSAEDPFASIPSKVKAKLTRAMNKSIILPYATEDMIKAKGKKIKKGKKTK